MTCSKCGNELKDGMIFCPVCGTELSIVPEFVPEIEISIEESLQDVATVISDKDDETPDEDVSDIDNTKDLSAASDTTDLSATDELGNTEEKDVRKMHPLFAALYIGILIIGATALIVFLGVMIYHDNSSTYQIKKGDEAFDAGIYRTAIDHYEKAVKIQPDNVEYRRRLADCYISMENIDMAVEVYRDMIVYDPNSTLAYAQIISLYESIGAYDDIDDFLQHYANDDIRAAFVDYLAYPPVVSHESGSYDEAIILTLTSESAGTIYYTDDGTIPSESSNVYTEPIYLKKGKHLIQTFFKNEYGVCSSTETYTYDIRAEAPSEPIVSLESGDYDKPQLIRIIVPTDCNVYYTLDDSTPDRYSRIYGEPIPISDGITHFKCIAINSNNVESDVVEKEYRITVVTAFPPEMGLIALYQHLADKGYIKDTSGNSEYYPGRFNYMYSEMRYIGGRTLYCYNEYYNVGTGVKSMTSNVFGMDCNTGEVFLVKKGNNDSYSISPF